MPLWLGVILILISATLAIAGVILWLRLRDEKAWAFKKEMELSQKNSELEKALSEERERMMGQVQKIAELEAQAAGLHKRLAEQLEQKDKDQEFLKLQFQSLSQKLFDHYTQLMQAQAGKEISQVLAPLRDQLGQFHQSLQQKYETELKERHSLKNEIERLIQMNDRMLLEAHQLTQALRGDNKVQGDWGELVLERILEASGLKQGQEYEVQESKLSEEGERYRPDVLIYLPEGRHIVIDSKVSLKSYESYRQAEQEGERQQHLEAFFQSVKRHIDGLSAKSYQKLLSLIHI
ncbi:MAG: DNA recombination protein RmuC [Bdellovibrionaceae bacterium]|nr:DNA recombination protein RmuC [Pseudobdellovibrionaceae bacterium]